MSSDNSTLLKIGIPTLTAALIAWKLLFKKQGLVKQRVAGLELGGTTCKVCLGEKIIDMDTGEVIIVKILKKKIISTQTPEETILALLQFLEGESFDQLGIASFGPLCLDSRAPNYGSVTSTPKKNWKDFPLLKFTQENVPRPLKRIAIDTDVNACAYVEFLHGEHEVKESLAYITVGTGVGVGLIINGKTVHGLIHPEGGHQKAPLYPDDEFEGVCPFHSNCVEGFVNNIAIAQRTGLGIDELPTLSDNDKVWRIIGYYLAHLCLNITYICSPEVIIIGGGVLNRSILYKIIQNEFKKILNEYLVHPRIEG